MYPNLIAECLGEERMYSCKNMCGIHPQTIARVANITEGLFYAVLDGREIITEGEATAIAREMNRCRSYPSVPVVTPEYLLSSSLATYTADTDAKKAEFKTMINDIKKYCGLKICPFNSRGSTHKRWQREARDLLPMISVAMSNTISFARYRKLIKEIEFIRHAIREACEAQIEAVPRGIANKDVHTVPVSGKKNTVPIILFNPN